MATRNEVSAGNAVTTITLDITPKSLFTLYPMHEVRRVPTKDDLAEAIRFSDIWLIDRWITDGSIHSLKWLDWIVSGLTPERLRTNGLDKVVHVNALIISRSKYGISYARILDYYRLQKLYGLCILCLHQGWLPSHRELLRCCGGDQTNLVKLYLDLVEVRTKSAKALCLEHSNLTTTVLAEIAGIISRMSQYVPDFEAKLRLIQSFVWKRRIRWVM